jgi:hypothetical protein
MRTGNRRPIGRIRSTSSSCRPRPGSRIYADVNDRDYNRLAAAVDAGRIKATTKL